MAPRQSAWRGDYGGESWWRGVIAGIRLLGRYLKRVFEVKKIVTTGHSSGDSSWEQVFLELGRQVV